MLNVAPVTSPKTGRLILDWLFGLLGWAVPGGKVKVGSPLLITGLWPHMLPLAMVYGQVNASSLNLDTLKSWRPLCTSDWHRLDRPLLWDWDCCKCKFCCPNSDAAVLNLANILIVLLSGLRLACRYLAIVFVLQRLLYMTCLLCLILSLWCIPTQYFSNTVCWAG